MADASQVIGCVMVTMTVEISVTKPKPTAAGKVSFFIFPHFSTYKHREYFVINAEDLPSANGKRENVFVLGKDWNGKYVKCSVITQKCILEEERIWKRNGYYPEMSSVILVY